MGVQYANPQIVTNGLVLNLNAGDRNSYVSGSTTWTSLTGGGVAGIITGSAPKFDSRNGGSINFNRASSDFCAINYTGSDAGSYTWEAWAQRGTSSLFIPLSRGRDGFGSGWSMYLGISATQFSANIVTTSPSTAGVSATSSVGFAVTTDIGVWHNIVGTWTAGSKVDLYVNGILAGTSATTSTNLRSSSTGWSMATLTTTNYYSGSVAIARVYDRVLSAQEIFQNYNANCTRFGLAPILTLPTAPQGFINGLFGRKYSGYFSDSVSWFSTATITNTEQTTLIDKGSDGDGYSWMWLGYFLPSTTETYTFYTTSDDASYLWVGSNAQSGYTTGNALVNNGGLHGAQERSGNISLTAGVYYPIRIMFGENGGGDSVKVEFSSPSVSRRTNGSGYYFDGSAQLFTDWP